MKNKNKTPNGVFSFAQKIFGKNGNLPDICIVGGPIMKLVKMNQEEMSNHYVGEAITLTAVMAIAAIAIIAVVVYKLFLSDKGSAAVPGGWKFTWTE